MPEPEWTFWMDDGNMSRATGAVHSYFLNARRIFADIAGEVRRFKPGAEVAPGIVSVPAYGHTPGHTAFADPFRQPIAAGDERHRARAVAVRASPGVAAELRHGRAAGGQDAHAICSTARPPTACWSRPITSPSRPAVTSSRAAPATSSCR